MKAYFLFFLSWLIPGSSHFLLKKKTKSFVFFFGIILMIALGIFMKGGLTSLSSMQPLTILSFIGSIGNGAFYFLLKLTGLGHGDLTSATFYYGSAFIDVAGFLNLLIAVNAYAIAKGAKNV